MGDVMRFVVSKHDLEASLKIIAPVVDQASEAQVLSCVKIKVLEATENAPKPCLTLTAANLDQFVETEVAHVEADAYGFLVGGEVLLPYAILSRAVAAIPNGNVLVSVDEWNRVHIWAEGMELCLEALSAKTFPEIPKFELYMGYGPPGQEIVDLSYSFKAEILCGCLRRIAYAASKGDANRVLTGILFSYTYDWGSVSFAATDGCRIVSECAECDSDSCQGKLEDVVIPFAAATVICNVSDAVPKDSSCKISISKSFLARFAFEGTTVYTRLLQGAYPYIWSKIPSTADVEGSFAKVEFGRLAFLDALDHVSVISSDEHRRMVCIRAEKGVAELSVCVGRNVAKSKAPVTYFDEPLKVELDSRHLASTLRNLTKDDLVMYVPKKDAGYGDFIAAVVQSPPVAYGLSSNRTVFFRRPVAFAYS
jgi:DNA polymerase III sliding clamp (beta) subunit (PCNA family)